MCGRFSYKSEQITPWLEETFGLPQGFDKAQGSASEQSRASETNLDVRPSSLITALAMANKSLKQGRLAWGIQPSWSKKLIINAQSETVAEKKTFQEAFAKRRCLIPISGWYEWKDEGGVRKQKYYFASDEPLLMAGIWFKAENKDNNEIVSLTTQPNEKCLAIHHRMPVFIASDCVQRWFEDEDVSDLLLPINDDLVSIQKVSA